MFKFLMLPVVLLIFFSFCTTPSEPPFQNLQDQSAAMPAARPFQKPDTAGLYLAYQAAKSGPGGAGLPVIPPSSWGMLAFTDARSGMIPAGTFFDDSIRFDVVFFRTDSAGFRFYTAERQPAKPEGVANR